VSLVIGYGNTLRSDDGIGSIVAEAIGGIACFQLNPELAELISCADFLVLIDACYGEKAGEIQLESLDTRDSQPMTHQSSPAKLLQMAKEIYGSVPPTLLITITGADFNYGDKLSPQLEAILPQIIEGVQTIIQSHDKA
jgi:hydrogenase maturation protease